jgi:hypothetical protein
MQGRSVQEALICSDDQDAREIAVMQDQARGLRAVGQPERQENIKFPDLGPAEARGQASGRPSGRREEGRIDQDVDQEHLLDWVHDSHRHRDH